MIDPSLYTSMDQLLAQRVPLERRLGRESFYAFYAMAWPHIDPEPFVPGRHIRLICHHMQRAARREIRRLAICIPPRHSKSLICSVAFPAWVWTWWPSAKFITASYAQPLATRDALAARRLVESPWYQARWPEVAFQPDQNQKTHFQTTRGGTRFVGSPSTGVTGHGSDFNVFDDPHDITSGESEKDRERTRIFWFETMSGRFNSPQRGVSIVIQQRVHQRDIAGECIQRGYQHCVLPARFELAHPQRHQYDWRTVEGQELWPEKFDPKTLELLWSTLGGADGYAVAGQQQQRPQPRSGGLFKRHWFKTIETLPPDIEWWRAWDLASTEKMAGSDPDYTAGCKFGFDKRTKTYIIGHMVRDRLDPGGVEQLIKATAQQDGRNVGIFLPQDPGQAGKAQIAHYVRELAGYTVKFATMSGSKTDRASPFASQASIGAISLYRADWNQDFLDEICAFPTGAHDDQVDAAASGFAQFIVASDGMLDWIRGQAEALKAPQDLPGMQKIVDYIPQGLR